MTVDCNCGSLNNRLVISSMSLRRKCFATYMMCHCSTLFSSVHTGLNGYYFKFLGSIVSGPLLF